MAVGKQAEKSPCSYNGYRGFFIGHVFLTDLRRVSGIYGYPPPYGLWMKTFKLKRALGSGHKKMVPA
ncbi:hypothetical protein APA22_00940 [Acetobacter pasteurianus IFO 3283-22]|uniref:Uncharacterized protein n=1 Tax=Acetobacter pasteurianus (strain NBRC 105184 / IFO 3283-01) TaxID=634452 RepID=C7JAX5_ACEP3|nr:hypothetical protein APA01_00940 [Acetobacter pasteurianus IFO 3283-01]BAI01302.1 hypothetical protein APA03_00940 [Acetobacter pasteurianus IFO 3283-03]BAI04350.1 hypothetical protein APA07_00940 [Acetobacter pasteurianus IFO 3283-07]BAI07397.1 hypothetical protein APA22_00940 [Acetobacter pasteurianus IFO 3283-22]BAI10445.1 hypothetical protein APA26_00940 [Acetobacter pasteurianus IFO 3283-26]BAI13493.1 hypothetical protein APA32_00940 [Acetobacter pasteurianus IFO 3283-32]BAI16539.1 hy